MRRADCDPPGAAGQPAVIGVSATDVTTSMRPIHSPSAVPDASAARPAAVAVAAQRTSSCATTSVPPGRASVTKRSSASAGLDMATTAGVGRLPTA